MYIVYERIDDDSHWQEPTQINMIMCFHNEDDADNLAKKLEKGNAFKGEIIVDFAITADKKGGLNETN